jgi:YVTN family beta-propeller protein
MPAIRRSLVLCVVAFGVVLSLPAAAQQQANFTTIQTGGQAPTFVAANPVTNTIYVTNFNTNNLTVIDGYNNIPQLVNVDNGPAGIGINPVTNKIYVAGQNANLVTVVDGATLSTISVSAGRSPERIAVNQVTNLIYVANNGSNNVTVIDGSDNSRCHGGRGR